MGDVLVVMEIGDGVQNVLHDLAGVVLAESVFYGESDLRKIPGCIISLSNSSPPLSSSMTRYRDVGDS